jgi:hypothetical protein
MGMGSVWLLGEPDRGLACGWVLAAGGYGLLSVWAMAWALA